MFKILIFKAFELQFKDAGEIKKLKVSFNLLVKIYIVSKFI